MISVIYVQHNNGALTLEAIKTLRQHHPEGLEIVVVDNASTDDAGDLVEAGAPGVTIIRNSINRGFGAANNQAARVTRGEHLCFLNNDTLCRGEALHTAARRFADLPSLGIYAPRLVYGDGTFQLSAGPLPGFWREALEKFMYTLERRRNRLFMAAIERRYSVRRSVGWVTGAALMIRRPVFEQVGGFDEAMFMYFEDKDLCARVRKLGYDIEFDPAVELVHLKGGSSTGDLSAPLRAAYRASQRRYYAKHRPRYEQVLLSWYQHLISRGADG